MTVGYIAHTIALPPIGDLKREIEPDAATSPLPGVYLLWKGDRLVYCGQTAELGRRITTHRKTKDFDTLSFLPLDDESERLRLEGLLILAHLPPLNRALCLRLAAGRITPLYYRELWRRQR